MRNILETLIEKAGKGVSLTERERARLTDVVGEYMALKPVRHVPAPASTSTGLSVFSLLVGVRRVRFVAAALVVTLFFGGSVSYAAEEARPGDLLYAVKVSVNEPVRAVLAVGTDAQVAWQTRVVERRLEEAVALAAEGALSEERSKEVAVRFERDAQAAEDFITAFEQQEPDQALAARSQFDAVLVAHSGVLSELSARARGRGEESGIAELLAQNVRGKVKNIGRIAFAPEARIGERTSIAAELMVAPSATVAVEVTDDAGTKEEAEETPRLSGIAIERLIAATKKAITIGKELLARYGGSLEEETVVTFRSELASIEAEYELALKAFAEGQLSESYELLLETIKRAHRLSVALRTTVTLHVNVSPSVHINGVEVMPSKHGDDSNGEPSVIEINVAPAFGTGGGVEVRVEGSGGIHNVTSAEAASGDGGSSRSSVFSTTSTNNIRIKLDVE